MSDGSITIDTKVDNSGIESGLKKIGSITSSALKGCTVAVGTTAAAIGGLVVASVNAFAEYEQLVGGVDTLFKESSKKVQEYADIAYKTAGLSANEYMNTVTSFSASLLQSLGGDTEKSAEYANQAIIDMSDNANKMGTSMESIQYAYQGFAKQNYTMLDNLKLGYGGTKEEMERLLTDAEKISGVKYDISSFADVTQAIHVIQTEIGITGTTAKEASTTISGSINSMKSSWNNLLTGLSNGNADISVLIDNFVSSVSVVGENLLPVVEQALAGISELISELLPQIAEKIPEIINEVLPELITSGVNAINSLLTGIQQNLPALIDGALQIISTLATGILDMLPQIYEMGIQLIISLIDGLANQMPELIPQIIDCVLLIAETLLDNIDMLIDAGIKLIIALSDGLIKALPKLIDKIPIIIDKLINEITNNLPKIVEMGIILIVKLAIGLIKAIPQLLSKIPQIIGSLINGFANYYSKFGEVGLNLIKGLWNGISDAAGWLWGKVSGFCGDLLGKIKGFFGIHSPSKVFENEIGKYLALGLGEGFDKNLSNVYGDMQKTVDIETGKLSANLTSNSIMKVEKNDKTEMTLKAISDNKEIVIHNYTDLDGKIVANSTKKVFTKQQLQYGY